MFLVGGIAELSMCGPEQSAVQYYCAKYVSRLVFAAAVSGKDLYSSGCCQPFHVKVQSNSDLKFLNLRFSNCLGSFVYTLVRTSGLNNPFRT